MRASREQLFFFFLSFSIYSPFSLIIIFSFSAVYMRLLLLLSPFFNHFVRPKFSLPTIPLSGSCITKLRDFLNQLCSFQTKTVIFLDLFFKFNPCPCLFRQPLLWLFPIIQLISVRLIHSKSTRNENQTSRTQIKTRRMRTHYELPLGF